MLHPCNPLARTGAGEPGMGQVLLELQLQPCSQGKTRWVSDGWCCCQLCYKLPLG